MGTVHYQFVDKPKLGIYVWATRCDWTHNFFCFKIHVGTYNGLEVCVLGFEARFVVAVGDWHPKYKEYKDVQVRT